MFLLTKKPKMSQEERILARLRRGGKHGVFNYELARADVGNFSYHRRVTDLRAKGFVIDRVRVKNGIHKYYLVEEPSL